MGAPRQGHGEDRGAGVRGAAGSRAPLVLGVVGQEPCWNGFKRKWGRRRRIGRGGGFRFSRFLRCSWPTVNCPLLKCTILMPVDITTVRITGSLVIFFQPRLCFLSLWISLLSLSSRIAYNRSHRHCTLFLPGFFFYVFEIHSYCWYQ